MAAPKKEGDKEAESEKASADKQISNAQGSAEKQAKDPIESMADKTDNEVQKLLEINQTNLEIWDRLNSIVIRRNDAPAPKKTHGAMEGDNARGMITPKKIQVAQDYDIMLVGFEQRAEEKDLIVTTKSMKQPNFKAFKPPKLNMFNDTLPSDSYFDLSKVINKYAMLRPERCGDVIAQWKKALEAAQVTLRTIESQRIQYQQLAVEGCKLLSVPFPLPTGPLRIKCKQAEDVTNVDCRLTISSLSSLVRLKSILTLIELRPSLAEVNDDDDEDEGDDDEAEEDSD